MVGGGGGGGWASSRLGHCCWTKAQEVGPRISVSDSNAGHQPGRKTAKTGQTWNTVTCTFVQVTMNVADLP